LISANDLFKFAASKSKPIDKPFILSPIFYLLSKKVQKNNPNQTVKVKTHQLKPLLFLQKCHCFYFDIWKVHNEMAFLKLR
ncbi:hypothetical protein ABUR93_14810, partial [Staphylococcus aureus]